MRPLTIQLTASLLITIAFAGCAGNDSGGGTPTSGAATTTGTGATSTGATTSQAAAPQTHNVEFYDYDFRPKPLSIRPGDKVVFTSTSSKGHDLRIHESGKGATTFEKEQTVMNGGTMDHTFTKTGTFHVFSFHYCTPCQSGSYDAPNTMSMTITVSGTAAASQTTMATSTSGTASGNTVEFVDYEFKPKELSITAGTKVTWVSKSSKGHDIKIHKAGSGHSTYEKEQTVMNGGTMEHTFGAAGTYHVYSFHYCTPCQSGTYDAPNTMAMTITVT